MICADFLAGVSLEAGKQEALLPCLTRLVIGLPKPQIRQLIESVQVTLRHECTLSGRNRSLTPKLIRTGRERIAMHGKAQLKHSVLTFAPHHQGIPLGARRPESKILIHLRQIAPVVETRSLAAYERAANGGGR